jgi:hypothetical protein
MPRWPQFSIRSLFVTTTCVAVSLTVSRVFALSIVESACAVGSVPAFAVGPFLLIWGVTDWRPVLKHKRRWLLLATSFGMLAVNLSITPILVMWWLANIPGYLIFWIVAKSDGRNRAVAQQGTAAERSHLRCSANGGGMGKMSRCSTLIPSARAVTAVPPVG